MDRVCFICNSSMVNDCDVLTDFELRDVKIRKSRNGFLNNSSQELKAAVCTNCGNVIFYVEDFKKFID